MFKVGDKAKGFKFKSDTDSVHYDNDMDDYVGVIGEVVESWKDSFVILFPDQLEWMYPASLWHLAKVEQITSFDVGEDVSFKVGDKVIPSFQIGDRVKFKKSSIDSGMIDATEDRVFTVHDTWNRMLSVKEMVGDYHMSHFEHVEEEIMNNAEEQGIKWEVGQIVWDCSYGNGVVESVSMEDNEIHVYFPNNNNAFNFDVNGVVYGGVNRSLFFSEPKIEAEKFPPKKPFVAKLKEGDEVLIEGPRGGQIFRREVKEETEDKVICKYAGEFEKIGYKFTKLGEEIIFN